MKYHNIGDAIAGMIDQTQRGMTNHEYELHLKRIKRYANKVQECEDALKVFSDDDKQDERYIKWVKMLDKYKAKLEAELNMGM